MQGQRIFVCISIIGCKGVSSTSEEEGFFAFYSGTIDRNMLMCNPIVLDDIDSYDEQEVMKKKLYIEYMLSIGKKNEKDLDQYIKDVYH